MILSLAKCLALAAAAFGSACAQQECLTYYLQTTNDIKSFERDAVNAQSIFNQYCRSDRTVRNTSLSLSDSSAFKDISDTFSISGNNTTEKLESFCKTYDEKVYGYEKVSSYSKSVVREGMSNFNQCLNLVKGSVSISHTTNQNLVNIIIKFDAQINASLNSIQFDKNLVSCTLNGVGKLNPPIRPIKLKGNSTVSCERRKIPLPNGSGDLPETPISLIINSLPYDILLRGNRLYGYTDMNMVKTQIDVLEKNTADLKSRLSELQIQLNNTIAKEKSLQNRRFEARVVVMVDPPVAPYEGWMEYFRPIDGDNDARVKDYMIGQCKALNGELVFYRKAAGGPRSGHGYSYWLYACSIMG